MKKKMSKCLTDGTTEKKKPKQKHMEEKSMSKTVVGQNNYILLRKPNDIRESRIPSLKLKVKKTHAEQFVVKIFLAL